MVSKRYMGPSDAAKSTYIKTVCDVCMTAKSSSLAATSREERLRNTRSVCTLTQTPMIFLKTRKSVPWSRQRTMSRLGRYRCKVRVMPLCCTLYLRQFTPTRLYITDDGCIVPC
jgi:hypothetical protein